MNTPSVSIVIAVYNAEPYLHRCMESLLNQTLHNIEILLINDGSTDNSGALCDEYATKDPRVKVFHRTNHGVAATRQFGLEHVTGEYVIHADPDDWLDLDMLEKMYEMANKEEAEMVICDYVKEFGDHTQQIHQQPTSTSSEQILPELYSKIHGSLCNKIIRHDCILRYNINFIDKVDVGEDVLFTLRLLQHPIHVAYCPNVLYHYDNVSNTASYTRTVSKETVYKQTRFFSLWREYASNTVVHNIDNAEINIAFLSIRTNAYSKEQFYDVFKHIKDVPLFAQSNNSFQVRFVVWSAFHISHEFAQFLMNCKLWYRKHIKRIKE